MEMDTEIYFTAVNSLLEVQDRDLQENHESGTNLRVQHVSINSSNPTILMVKCQMQTANFEIHGNYLCTMHTVAP